LSEAVAALRHAVPVHALLHKCHAGKVAIAPVITALDINSFTPVRMLADCVGTTEVLQYERDVSHGCSVSFVSTPHTRWLNGNSSDTVGLTPHICKGNHDEPCYQIVRGLMHQPSRSSVHQHVLPRRVADPCLYKFLQSRQESGRQAHNQSAYALWHRFSVYAVGFLVTCWLAHKSLPP